MVNANTERIRFKTSNPTFYPVSSRVPILDDFRDLLSKNMEIRKNVTSLQFQAVSELRGNTNLIIRQADKGGSIVLLELYASAVSQILEYDTTYGKLSVDPMIPFQKSLYSLLQEGLSLGVITQK